MFEETRTVAKRSTLRAKPFGLLSFISLLALVAACLSGSLAQARSSEFMNKDQSEQRRANRVAYQKKQEEHPKLEQGASFDDVWYPEEAFSQSDDYLKMNSFIVGLKLSDTYTDTDACINDVVYAVDGTTYYNNNVTVHEKLLANNTKSGLFEPYLNATGLLYGPVADALPNCYAFLVSFQTVENARFLTFNSNWGNFFLAFLFNQMGNALNFQTKFERIQVERERQNYPGVWQEYGDLVYLIWTFQPIEETTSGSANLEKYDSLVEEWMKSHEWLAEDAGPIQKAAISTGVSGLASVTHSAGLTFGIGLQAFKNVVADSAKSSHKQFQQTWNESGIVKGLSPVVKTAYADKSTQEKVTESVNGIFTGIVDVFPYDSNPTRCQANFTNVYNAGSRLATFTGSYDTASTTGKESLVTDISDILKAPFGISYSCYWGFSTIVVDEDPLADGVISEDEALEKLIVISNDVVTNLFFNLGYIYAAGVSIKELNDQAATSRDQNWFKDVGIYTGDILIRFIWRRKFTRNFEY